MKAIFIDIDETLTIAGRGPFPDDVAEIRAARARGHKIILSTGRSFGNLPPALQNADFVDGMVLGAGAEVRMGGRLIHQKFIPQDELKKVCAYYLRQKRCCVFEGELGLYGIFNNFDAAFFVKGVLPITRADDFAVKYASPVVSKITIAGEATAEEEALFSGFFHLNPFPDYFEAIIKGESKSGGMEIVLRYLGLEREDSIAIGDSMNDLDAIKFAGVGVAMGNACTELKEAAAYISAPCGEGGVARAIRKWAG